MEVEEEKTGTLIEHLEELRLRIIRSLFAVAILFPASWPLSQIVIEWLKRSFFPDPSLKLYYTAPMELFFLRMKVSAAIGVIVAIPYIAWQVWGFVAPALFKKERNCVLALALSSSFFFFAGAAFFTAALGAGAAFWASSSCMAAFLERRTLPLRSSMIALQDMTSSALARGTSLAQAARAPE